MRENRTSGSEGGEAQTNELSLPLSLGTSRVGEVNLIGPRRVLLHWERHGVGEVWEPPPRGDLIGPRRVLLHWERHGSAK